MLKNFEKILKASRDHGWIMEPDAKAILRENNVPVPNFQWARNLEEALQFAKENGYPVAAKVVSPKVIHKSDVGGVSVDIANGDELTSFFRHCSGLPEFAGIVVEEMVRGLELIVGAQIDHQFGPTILLGIGGTGVEIYQDVAIRMLPITSCDIQSMIKQLQGSRLLTGYRGEEPVSMEKLSAMLLAFADLVMKLENYIESIDLNPVFCSATGCVAADARIMLA